MTVILPSENYDEMQGREERERELFINCTHRDMLCIVVSSSLHSALSATFIRHLFVPHMSLHIYISLTLIAEWSS